jgi:hypothetical protein
MKQDKGEAAFTSVDEVLAEKIVANSKDHGEKAQEEPEPRRSLMKLPPKKKPANPPADGLSPG